LISRQHIGGWGPQERKESVRIESNFKIREISRLRRAGLEGKKLTSRRIQGIGGSCGGPVFGRRTGKKKRKKKISA